MITIDPLFLEQLISDLHSGYFVLSSTGTTPICANRLYGECKYYAFTVSCKLSTNEEHAAYLEAIYTRHPEFFI